jgi:hypothetical protein
MAIITKNNTTAGTVPAAASLVVGELAVNTADGFIYTKHTDGVVKRLTANPPTSVNLVGTPTASTATAGTSTNQIATTAFVTNSPALNGVPTAPTAAPGTNTAQIATTSFATTADNNLQSQINGKQNALGYTPVQQGTGIGQFADTIAIGWAGGSLKCTVDDVDLGKIWTDYNSASSLNSNGYQKLSSGLIIQWGRGSFNASLANGHSGIGVVNFPVVFPNAVFALSVIGNGQSIDQTVRGFFSYSTRSTSLFIPQYTQILYDSTYGVTITFDWIAIGF